MRYEVVENRSDTFADTEDEKDLPYVNVDEKEMMRSPIGLKILRRLAALISSLLHSLAKDLLQSKRLSSVSFL